MDCSVGSRIQEAINNPALTNILDNQLGRGGKGGGGGGGGGGGKECGGGGGDCGGAPQSDQQQEQQINNGLSQDIYKKR